MQDDETYGKLVLVSASGEHADVKPRPPLRDAYSIFWVASVQSRDCKESSVCVWATNRKYYWGWTLPKGADLVAEFYRDQMVYCVWGDAQREFELQAEIERELEVWNEQNPETES